MSIGKHPAPRPGGIIKRFATTAPFTYDDQKHTCDALLSSGSAVVRAYGTEKLRISPQAVDVGRVARGQALLIDSHRQSSISDALGKIQNVWFQNGELWATLEFNRTPQGRAAEQMVARGELTGISIGYSVSAWEITDADGNKVDPSSIRWNDDIELTYLATRWELVEASLVTVPADGTAGVRSLAGTISAPQHVIDARSRMRAVQRMVERMVGEDASTVKARMLARQRKVIP